MLSGLLGDARFAIALDPSLDPEILDWLRRRLPMETIVHASRIAGNQFYVNTDLVIGAPKDGHNVNHIAAGTWIFWPNRQLLECIVGEINRENTPVIVVGSTAEGLDELLATSEAVKTGARVPLTLEWTQPPGRPPAPADRPAGLDERRALKALDDLCLSLWSAEPPFVAEIAARRGLMQPTGGIVMLEAIASRHQEALWHAFNRRDEFDRQALANAVDILATSFIEQIDQTLAPSALDFAPLLEICRLAEHFSERGVEHALTATIKVFGAVAHWSDLTINWPRLHHAYQHGA